MDKYIKIVERILQERYHKSLTVTNASREIVCWALDRVEAKDYVAARAAVVRMRERFGCVPLGG